MSTRVHSAASAVARARHARRSGAVGPDPRGLIPVKRDAGLVPIAELEQRRNASDAEMEAARA